MAKYTRLANFCHILKKFLKFSSLRLKLIFSYQKNKTKASQKLAYFFNILVQH
ncbi:unknown; predicted coding region [Mycoplasmopsis pulmonis]|uniref:Uncharacterized protein n=1 Tax=Mycoplasmopsis pulmonis (strain UAB CTIP) TaxID=272635 RepID=Q98PF8_MYCPU|nr:unknown; predicted coding region [Mycoplasmopsis pulmonis]